MTPRSRRLLTLLGIAVPVLLIGRALADAVTAFWWASSISSDAVAGLARWHLLRSGVFIVVLLVTVFYWFGHYLGVRRLPDSARPLANSDASPGLTVQTFAAILAAALVVITMLLQDPDQWTAAIALRNAGVEYGVSDPLLGRDLGYLIADHPLTRLLHRFAVHLVLAGLLYVATIHLILGGIRRTGARLLVSEEARFVIGRLLMLLALLIALGYLLAPSLLAVSVDVPIEPRVGEFRLVAAWLLAGIAFATALLSLPWIRGRRGNLLLSGWAVLAIAAITERLVVPAFLAEMPANAERDVEQRRIEQAMYGIRLVESMAVDSLPPVIDVWDERVLTTLAVLEGQRPVGALPAGNVERPHWLVASTPVDGPTRLMVRDVPSTAAVIGTAGLPTTTQVDPGSLPGATGWAVTHGGVRVGSWPRRLILAWTLQGPGVLALEDATTIDWLRDPQERLTELVPPLEWRTTGLTRIDDALHWVVTGYAVVPEAPLATRVAFDGATVSGVVPALVALVRSSDGQTTVYRDPAGGPLGRAWARAFAPMVRDSLPAATAAALPYPGEWFARQITVLSLPHWDLGGLGAVDAVAPVATPVWLPNGTGLRVLLRNGDGQRPRTLLTATRRVDGAMIAVNPISRAEARSGTDLLRLLDDSPELGRLRDSIKARGDSLLAGAVRWHSGPAGVVAWRPFVLAGQEPKLAWLAIATADRHGGGRDVELALARMLAADTTSTSGLVDWRGRFREARTWLMQGDSALGRGDLTAFGRAWEALRRLIGDSIPE